MPSETVTHDLAEVFYPELDLRFHDGQSAAWNSRRRIVAVLAGTQGGKTSFGPYWLLREMRRRGEGDYLVVAPTYPLLDAKLLPLFRDVFVRQFGLGSFVGSPRPHLVMGTDGAWRLFGPDAPRGATARVLFGTATEPESLESATAKAAWLDEAGQAQFAVEAWEAVRRRVALTDGRILVTTSLYTNGWLKTRVVDRWEAGDQEIEVVRFASIANPRYPREEFARAERDLPRWKFQMQYLGQFARPAGAIYDCFDPAEHCVPPFPIPPHWKRYLGVDFGQQNTAATFWAEEPGTRRLTCYRTYHAGGVSVAAHARRLLLGEPGLPARAVGGSSSEESWRREFAAAGLPVRAPRAADVELGIDRVYGAIQRGEVRVFDTLADLKEEFMTYSRALDASGAPTAQIADKHSFHLLDSARYVLSELRPAAAARARAAKRLRDWYAPPAGGRRSLP